MSKNGIRAAQWIRRVQPARAATLAAEIRNAVTPASMVVSAGAEDMSGPDRESIQDTIRHLLAIADALGFEPVTLETDEPDDEPDDDDDDDDTICPTCNGSGEGMADNTTCRACGGSGDSAHPWGPARWRVRGDDE